MIETLQNPFLQAMNLTQQEFNAQIEGASVGDLEKKLNMLVIYQKQLNQESSINILESTEQQIFENIRDKNRKEQESRYVGGLIEQVQIVLKEKVDRVTAEEYSANARENWGKFKTVAEEAQQAMATAIALIKKMQEMNQELASIHYAHYNQYILDYRLPIEYQFPKIEQIGESIIVHNDHLPML